MLQLMKTRRVPFREDRYCVAQKSNASDALGKVQQLVRFAARPAQGGTCSMEMRGNKPNGTGWTKKFHSMRERVEKAVFGLPSDLRRSLQRDMTALKLPVDGGRFNSKSKWLFNEPLLRVEEALRNHVDGASCKTNRTLPVRENASKTILMRLPKGQIASSNPKSRVSNTNALRKALHKTRMLVNYCKAPAQGGRNELATRCGKPNGTGFSFHFHRQREGIETNIACTPKPLQKKLKADMKMMKTKAEGGRFDSKSRWIYMEPLERVHDALQRHACCTKLH